jgi:GH24 family phage-related lysozyme (muramidase)
VRYTAGGSAGGAVLGLLTGAISIPTLITSAAISAGSAFAINKALSGMMASPKYTKLLSRALTDTAANPQKYEKALIRAFADFGVNKEDLQAIQEAPQPSDGMDELPEGFTIDQQPDVTLPATIPDTSMTQKHEGLRLTVYPDLNTGEPLIGYGFNFNSGIAPKVWKQSGLAQYKRLADVKSGREAITPQEAQALYQTSYQIADNDARQYFRGFDKLSSGQQEALRDMAYQFGLPNLKKMRSLHNALQKGDKNGIVNAIRNSEYGKKYKDRARQITNLLVGEA